MPISRRSINNQYCNSNRRLFASNEEANSCIMKCESIENLINTIQNNNRYYKINLLPIKSSSPNFEIRNHSGTFSYNKITHYIRLLTQMLKYSIKFKPTDNFKENRSVDYKIDKMFEWIIKDYATERF